MINASGNTLIIDIRDELSFEYGHIDGAVNIPVEKLDKSDLPKDKKLLICCKSGLISNTEAEKLRMLGYDAENLEGGYYGWEKANEILGDKNWPGPINCVNPFRPTGLFETMVSRVCPYTIKGFLYYQGESDDHKPDSYYTLLTSLIRLWREKWGDDELPFIIVQLPMFKYAADPDYKHWCKIREAQMRAYKTVKNTGIAVISDCGEFNEIHPKDKVPVGERLCLQAEKLFYGMDVKAFGPIYKSLEYKNGGIELSFDHAENGFVVKGEAQGFEIAGKDEEFVKADITINGSKIFIKSDTVEKPLYARYNWFNYCEVTIFNETGIPLAPFRTEK